MHHDLEVRELSVHRGETPWPIIDQLSVTFSAGSINGLVGANGSGKTTLGLILAGVMPRIVPGRWSGDVWLGPHHLSLEGWPPSVRAAYAAQEHSSHLLLGTVGDAVASLPKRLQNLANELRLPEASPLGHLSTGQRHALELMLAHARGPQISVLDEALSSLDRRTAGRLIPALFEDGDEFEEGAVVILVDQREERLQLFAKRIVRLRSAAPCASGARRNGAAMIEEGATSHLATPPIDGPLAVGGWWPANKRGYRATFDQDCRAGCCVQLAGAIGSGKTTLLKVLAGFPGPRPALDSRRIERALRPHFLGASDFFVAGYSTIKDALESSLSREGAACVWSYLRDLLPGRTLSDDPAVLSFGQRRLLALTLTLASAKNALALDEPDRGLDSYAQEFIVEAIGAFVRRGGTVFMATHSDAFSVGLSELLGEEKFTLAKVQAL